MAKPHTWKLPVSTVKSWWLILAFLSGFALAMVTEELILNWHDNRLELAAPHVHFLSGKPLGRLRNAEAVPFDFQVTLWSSNHNHIFARLADRFVVSYSLWEEKFKVVKLTAPRRAVDHLGATAAEAWCLDQMSMDLTGMGDSQPFWVRLEIRAQDAKDAPLFGRGSINESGISLTSLIELFSRPAPAQQPHWGPYDAGPLTIEDLKRGHKRGS
jgi:hypothetical protein